MILALARSLLIPFCVGTTPLDTCNIELTFLGCFLVPLVHKQDFAPSELAKQPAVPDVKSAPSDLLGDCVMMEGIPSLMDESTTNTKTGLIESNWDSRLQESASPSAELGVPGPAKPVSSGGMQVALQDKATVKPK